MVRQPLEAKLDASASDHRPDLADPLPDHHRDLRVRICAGHEEEIAVDGGLAVRHQPRGEPDLHAHPVRNAEPTVGVGGHRDCLDHDHLDDVCRLEALQMGRRGTTAVLCLGIDCDRAATQHHMDEPVEVSDL